jgi:hypothetical protein
MTRERHTMNEKLLTTKEAAELLNLAPHTLESYRWQGIGPKFLKNPGVRGAVRYRESDLWEWLGTPLVRTPAGRMRRQVQAG